jgi:hypothetical protein
MSYELLRNLLGLKYLITHISYLKKPLLPAHALRG